MSKIGLLVILFALFLSVKVGAMTNDVEKLDDASSDRLRVEDIVFPEGLSDADAGMGYRIPLERHSNGRIKTYLKSNGRGWRLGKGGFTFKSENDFLSALFALDGGFVVSMYNSKGEKLYQFTGDKAVGSVKDKVGRCFGPVSLESEDITMSGTNMIWRADSEKKVIVESDVRIEIRNLKKITIKGL